MSRSYKHRKNAVIHFKERNSRFGKRQASSAVRRAVDVPKGRQYRKFYCSWNICDYEWTEKKYTRDEFRRKWFDTAHYNANNHGWDPFIGYRKDFRNWKEAYRSYIRYSRSK